MKQQLMVVKMEGVLILPFVPIVALLYTILLLVKFATNRRTMWIEIISFDLPSPPHVELLLC